MGAAALVAGSFYLPYAFLFDGPDGTAEAEIAPAARLQDDAEPIAAPAPPPAAPASDGPLVVPAPPPAVTPGPEPRPAAGEEAPAPEPAPPSEPEPEPSGPQTAIDQVREALADDYYLPIDSNVLAQPSVFAIVDALDDPFTEYLDEAAFQRLQDKTSVSYEGVGLLVSPIDDGLVVTSSFEGPAREAGVRPGDVIVSVDGREVGGLSLDRAAALIKGEQGTIVHLTIRRPGVKEDVELSVARKQISNPVVRTRVLRAQGKRFGYVRVVSFPEGAAGAVRDEVRRLLDEKVDGLVLDLRGNPGGLLDEAIGVASIFLRSGVVVETFGRKRDPKRIPVTGGSVAPDIPLVALVDRHSASAAEIVAAALRANDRARLVGRRTYGKGSVQSVLPLVNGGALRYTTAIYLTPDGKTVNHVGVKPDRRAEDDPATRRDEAIVAAERELVDAIERAAIPRKPPF
ncbi:MAG: S41 family peptidase [Thermoleophilia bacterium]